MTVDQDSAAAVRIAGVRTSFRDVLVLRDVTFDVPQGCILALLGSNGTREDDADPDPVEAGAGERRDRPQG